MCEALKAQLLAVVPADTQQLTYLGCDAAKVPAGEGHIGTWLPHDDAVSATGNSCAVQS